MQILHRYNGRSVDCPLDNASGSQVEWIGPNDSSIAEDSLDVEDLLHRIEDWAFSLIMVSCSAFSFNLAVPYLYAQYRACSLA